MILRSFVNPYPELFKVSALFVNYVTFLFTNFKEISHTIITNLLFTKIEIVKYLQVLRLPKSIIELMTATKKNNTSIVNQFQITLTRKFRTELLIAK